MAKINIHNTNKELFKNTSIIAIGQISVKVVNFLLLPLYTALLTKNEYGTVDLLGTYSTVIGVVVGLQMNQAVFRFLVTCRDNSSQTKKVTSTTLYSLFIVIIIYTIIFIAIQPLIVVEYKWYLLVHVYASLLLLTTSGIARGLGYNTDYAIANFISATVTIILNVLFLAVLHLGVSMMLWAYILGPLIGSLVLFFKCKIYSFLSLKWFSRKSLKELLSYSLPLIPNELSWSIIHASDRMVVSHFISVAANGLIAVASKFSLIYTTIFGIFNISWTEQVVLHYKDEGGDQYINDMFDKMITFFGSFAVMIIAYLPFFFNYLVDKNFSDSYQLVPIYISSVFFNAIIGLVTSIYLVEKETTIVAISTTVAATINLAVDLLLVNIIGVFAAPVSSLCGYLFVSVWRLIDINKRHCKIGIKKYKIAFLIAMLSFACYSYYYKQITLSIITAMIITISAVIVNFSFLKELKRIIKKD